MRPLRLLWFVGLTLGLGFTILASMGCSGGGAKRTGIQSELVAAADSTVTSLAFAPDGRLFLTEQNSGNIRIITSDGELLPEPFAHVDIAAGQEWGLLGVVVDPEFDDNHYVYTYFTQPAGAEPNIVRPVLMRLTEADNKGIDPTVIIEFPLANPEVMAHVGGGIHFGPDGYLYISIGDTERKQPAGDLSSPLGKILRVTRDGDPAPDNPFVDEPGADPKVYAYGLRNPFAFTFDPDSGRIYASENGPGNCDELNIVEAGNDYGYPKSLDVAADSCLGLGGVDPIYLYASPGMTPEEFGSNVAPTGLHFVSGQLYPALGDGLLVCEWLPRFMRRLQLAGPNKDEVIDDSVVVEDCTVAITADPEGIIYYSNVNEIRRLPPQ